MSFIETERLLLRTWMLPGDADDAFEIFGDPDVMQFIPVGACTRERSVEIVRGMIERNERDGFGVWPVVEKATRRVIGECGICYIPQYGRDVEVAWLFKKSSWRHGFATEAARAVLRYAFEEVRLPRIYALVDRENAASIAVANRLGMRYDRIVRAYKRDLMRYEATRPAPE